MVLILIFFIFTALVNLIGVLGPELSFDALWYHLTLPKIYLMEKTIRFFPGGLLYYSLMPRLGEVLYTVALFLADERLAKFIHFSFGILAAFLTYKTSREFVSRKASLLSSLIFYSTLIVGWQSTTAYVDLIRTAFEIWSLLYFIRWWRSEKNIDLTKSAVLLGLAISTKLLAAGSILIFISLIILKSLIKKDRKVLSSVICYLSFVILLPLPWFIVAYKATGNPFYPIGSGILDQHHRIISFSFIRFISDFWNLILKPEDPISPIFLIILPIGIRRVIREIREIGGKKKELFLLFIYGFFAYIIWYFTPRTGGGRFILPYLPAWSILVSLIIFSSEKAIKNFLISLVLFISAIHLGYRFMANKKYLPFVFGRQTKKDFLCQNLDFSTNVFYDCDGYFTKNIKSKEKVLIYCTHNLYYVDFPFIHESWLNPKDKFNYVMTQNCQLPEKFQKLPIIYQNKKTGVKLYGKVN